MSIPSQMSLAGLIADRAIKLAALWPCGADLGANRVWPNCGPAPLDSSVCAGQAGCEAIATRKVKVDFHVVSFLDRASTTDYSSRALNAAMVILDTAGPKVFFKYHAPALRQATVRRKRRAHRPAADRLRRTGGSRPIRKILLTVEEAAEVLGVGKSTVYDLMRMRLLRSVRIGRYRRIPVAVCYELVHRLPDEAPIP